MSVVGEIIQGVGGQQGVAGGVADIIGSIKGTNVPNNVTYVQAPQSTISPNMMLVLAALAVVVVLFVVFKK